MCKYEIRRGDYNGAKRLLIEKDLIEERHRNYLPPTLQITPLGKDFIARGGFVYEEESKENTISVTTLVITAIIVSAIATILSIVALVLALDKV
jgi:hypothetical protein